MLQLPGDSPVTARITLVTAGRTYQTNLIGFSSIAGPLRPTDFRLSGHNEEFRFQMQDNRILVRHVTHRDYSLER